MPDGSASLGGPPLLLREGDAARYVSMTLADFREAVRHGMLPAGRTPLDFATAGLLDLRQGSRLRGLGPLWHRLEIEACAARLWGLEAQAALRQSAGIAAAEEALRGFRPPQPRSPASRPGNPPRR